MSRAEAPEVLGELRARRALERVGMATSGPFEPVESVNNEVWMTPEVVVRVGFRPEHRLRREAQLAQVLPPEVGYPPVRGYGADMGSEWLVLDRLPGYPLSRCWPSMSQGDRRTAIRELADRLKLIHSMATPTLPPLRQVPQLIDPAPTPTMSVARLLVAIDRISRLPHVDHRVSEDLAAMVRSLMGALDPFTAKTLIHGDLSFENVLWDREAGRLTAILDFEWARGAPPDLDLDVLLRFCSYPDLHVPASYADDTKAEDYAEVPFWLAEDYPELFSSPHQLDRCRLYAIAWDIEELLGYPPMLSAKNLDERHPYRRLQSMLTGDSHLDRLDRVSGRV